MGIGSMTRYDLREFRRMSWTRGLAWFRVGMAVYLIGFAAFIGLGIYSLASMGRLNLFAVGFYALMGFTIAVIAWTVSSMRGGASWLVIDSEGIRLEYPRGFADSRAWRDTNFRIRGRRTEGALDDVSRGAGRQSIFGPRGGVSETFIPRAAFVELSLEAKIHGMTIHERPSQPGWIVYEVSRPP
jgi:hypothetical protein